MVFLRLLALSFCVCPFVYASENPVSKVSPYFEGKYEFAPNSQIQEWTEFLKNLGMSDAIIETFLKVNTVELVKINENTLRYKISSPHHTKQVDFHPGVEREDTFGDAVPFKSTINFDGNTATEVVKFPGFAAKCLYNYEAEGFLSSCSMLGKTISQYLKRVPEY